MRKYYFLTLIAFLGLLSAVFWENAYTKRCNQTEERPVSAFREVNAGNIQLLVIQET
jgi:hypothetical protein